jgi:hypothetical protein
VKGVFFRAQGGLTACQSVGMNRVRMDGFELIDQIMPELRESGIPQTRELHQIMGNFCSLPEFQLCD